jgi:hypothetical protein
MKKTLQDNFVQITVVVVWLIIGLLLCARYILMPIEPIVDCSAVDVQGDTLDKKE